MIRIILLLGSALLLSRGTPPRLPQTVAPLLNPGPTWQARLQVGGPPLCLPRSQRGIQAVLAVARCNGEQYPLQRWHFDAQGRLDTLTHYHLDAPAGRLRSQVSQRVVYRTQRTADSLVSLVDHQVPGPAGWFSIGAERLTGAVPPVEPLLGAGARAHRARLPPAGCLRQTPLARNLDPALNHAYWQWSVDRAARRGHWAFHQFYAPNDSYGRTAELNYRARTLTVTSGSSSGHTSRFTRQYTADSQDYVERCHFSLVLAGTGGASMEGDAYLRTTHWAKGLCRTEHFVVLDQPPSASGPPEFDVRYHYTFHSAKRARQLQ